MLVTTPSWALTWPTPSWVVPAPTASWRAAATIGFCLMPTMCASMAVAVMTCWLFRLLAPPISQLSPAAEFLASKRLICPVTATKPYCSTRKMCLTFQTPRTRSKFMANWAMWWLWRATGLPMAPSPSSTTVMQPFDTTNTPTPRSTVPSPRCCWPPMSNSRSRTLAHPITMSVHSMPRISRWMADWASTNWSSLLRQQV